MAKQFIEGGKDIEFVFLKTAHFSFRRKIISVVQSVKNTNRLSITIG